MNNQSWQEQVERPLERRYFTYTDEEGVKRDVTEGEYHTLWLQRYLWAGGIDPLSFCGRPALITIKGDLFKDYDVPTGYVIELENQCHWVRVIGLSTLSPERSGHDLIAVLHLESPLTLSIDTPLVISYIGFTAGPDDIFETQYDENQKAIGRKGKEYTPMWEIEAHLQDDTGDEDGYRQTYTIPFSLKLL